MSHSAASEVEKDKSLSIPEILADFFLRKIDMPSHSDDSDHKHKSKRKKSKHKKRKHKKSKHRNRSSSSDTSSKTSDLNMKDVVDDISSSEEMGIKRLKKIKSLKLQSVNRAVLQPTECDTKDKSDPSNSSTSENIAFYGPSLELLLSGIESNNSNSKPNDSSKILCCEEIKNVGCESDLNLADNSIENTVNKCSNLKPQDQISLDSSACGIINSKTERNNSHDDMKNGISCFDAKDFVNDCENITETLEPLEVNHCEVQKEQTSVKSSLDIESSNKKSSKRDSKSTSSTVRTKEKCDKKKHSRSRSRSKSQSKNSSLKSKYKRQTSRSPSRDSDYSSRKKKRHSRSHSREKINERKRRSYSRSHSKSRYQGHRKMSRSRSPYERHNHRRPRSRSSSYTRHKRRSESKTRNSKSKQRHRSLSKSRYRNKSPRRSVSRSRSKSKSKSRYTVPSKEKSRSKSKEKKSSQSSTKIDQAKVLETARKNVLKMMKNGTLPEGLPVENLKKEQIISIQAGGKSVQELTDFCQRLSQKENEPIGSDNEDKPDDETGFIHHPFKVKEPGMIKLNIKNAVQLPIKTHAQKVAETARLSSQFPVSSGNQHKQKELEWIPVVPETTKTETKPSEKVVPSTPEISSIAVPPEMPVSPIPPIPPPPPVPISYPCPPPLEVPQVEVSTPVPAMIPPPPPPMPTCSMPAPLQPPNQPAIFYQMPAQPIMQTYVTSNQPVMMSYPTDSVSLSSSSSVFKPPKKLDIPSIVTKRFQALTKLQENPNDPEALRTLQEAQESIQEWVQSQQVPGLFTGSTDAKVLSAAELCGPFKYQKFRKDMFSHAPPVTEGKGMSLLKKMGWNPGEGLGKNKEGSLEPLVLDIKMDKKGLVSEGENSKKGTSSFTKELQGKHPVSALMELCSKRRWKPPLYTCVSDHGPPHKKLFCFKVEVNGVEYQPLNPCSNKKVAKADSAVLCLQSLNVLPKTS